MIPNRRWDAAIGAKQNQSGLRREEKISLRKFRNKGRAPAALESCLLFERDGARGRSRTGTLLRAVDFLPTSAFAAVAQCDVRSLEHAFTVVLRP
jgi:hypothetical protein